MENLTYNQIDAVIDWMNTWEQLKNTAIPIRFKEDFTKQLCSADVDYTKPPIGIMPNFIWKEHRKCELMSTINRYINAGSKIPKEWIIEFNEYCI